MQKYTKIYMDALGYTKEDFIPCELSKQEANDIHHIISRGKGGEDRIENLMAITRELHHELGDKKKHMIHLLNKHQMFLAINGVDYDMDWFDKKINYYENLLI